MGLHHDFRHVPEKEPVFQALRINETVTIPQIDLYGVDRRSPRGGSSPAPHLEGDAAGQHRFVGRRQESHRHGLFDIVHAGREDGGVGEVIAELSVNGLASGAGAQFEGHGVFVVHPGDEREIVQQQRRLLDDSRKLVDDLDMLPKDLEVLEDLRQQLDELFLVVVVGEYNAGKSTFLNALLEADLLETGELPTTRQVHLLRYGSVENITESEPGLLIHELPAELLQDLNIVDTPGTNSMQREEQALTEGYVPRADLVFFLTSLMQPYSASEHEFLKVIRSWGKQIVFVINQVDLAQLLRQLTEKE